MLGYANNKINETNQWILKDNGKIISRRTVKKLTAEHLTLSNEVEKGKSYAFDKKFRYILDESIDLTPEALDPKYLTEDDDEVIYDL